ncbi:MAG TPA: glycoside hydrolase family 31 protein, partial [Longilinea sp.]|nr:glycoside hydrolase family 31 protein [Longilinea sp.]
MGSRGERFIVNVLEETLVRVRHLPDGEARLDRTWTVVDRSGDTPWEGRNRDDLTPFSLPPFQLEQHPHSVTLQTKSLELAIHTGEFRIDWKTAGGIPLTADLKGRAYPYDLASPAVFHYLKCQPEEHYFGFGEVSGEFNKAGRQIQLRNVDALGYDAKTGGPLYKHFPFYITYNAQHKIAYGIYYDNLSNTVFDLGQEKDNYFPPFRSYRADSGDIDYYFIYGPTIEAVVEKFTMLTGRMALPPRWSLGYLASSMKYTEAPDAQAQLKEFIQLCRQHDIPCSLFHLSSGYTLGDDGNRYVFEWNRQRFPDPAGMVKDFHQAGIRLAANIKPALLTTHPHFSEVQAAGGFIRQAASDDPQLSFFWGGEGAHIDFTSPSGIGWWKKQVKSSLLDLGIDCTWNDNNEYEIWDDEARCSGFGKSLRTGQIRPIQTLLMMRASREAQQEANPGLRPFSISRAGCPGMQRYVQSWSGDNFTSWETLKYNIPMGLGISLSGMPNSGHDVGGFAGPLPDPELFVRWVQNGIFQPRFTIHSWKMDGEANEPWMYPQVLPQIRSAIHLRYRLMPYLYSLLVEASQTGHPLLRPLVYRFPDDPKVIDESFDFMIGPSLLVASILEPGQTQRPVYLPSGQRWLNFYTQEWLEGGQNHPVSAPLEYIPLFMPESSLLPMGNVVHSFNGQSDDLRCIYLCPHKDQGESSFDLYEDDGESMDYAAGSYTRIHIDLHCSAYSIEIALVFNPYTFQLPYKNIEFVLPLGEERPLKVELFTREWIDETGRRH